MYFFFPLYLSLFVALCVHIKRKYYRRMSIIHRWKRNTRKRKRTKAKSRIIPSNASANRLVLSIITRTEKCISVCRRKISIKKFDKQKNLSRRHAHENLKNNLYIYNSRHVHLFCCAGRPYHILKKFRFNRQINTFM